MRSDTCSRASSKMHTLPGPAPFCSSRLAANVSQATWSMCLAQGCHPLPAAPSTSRVATASQQPAEVARLIMPLHTQGGLQPWVMPGSDVPAGGGCQGPASVRKAARARDRSARQPPGAPPPPPPPPPPPRPPPQPGRSLASVVGGGRHGPDPLGRLLSQVQCALSRRRKEETVETLTKQLESSALVFGVRFQHISARPHPTCLRLEGTVRLLRHISRHAV